MRIALIGRNGTGKAAFDAFVAQGATVAGVFCTGSGVAGDALEEAAREKGIEVLRVSTLEGDAVEAAMRRFAVDVAVMAFGDEAVSPAVAGIPRHGAIQVHASLLPRYRGPSPTHWTIARGEAHAGVTVIRPTLNPHEGAVVLQRTCAIGPADTLGELWHRDLLALGVDALVEAAGLVLSGEQIEVEQDEDAATYEGIFGEAEAEIHWANHAEITYNLIRAANPKPGAWTLCGGKRLRILDADLQAVHRRSEVTGAVGEVCAVDQDGFSVCAPGGRIAVRSVAVEGGDPQSAAEFAGAGGVAIGQRLGA